VVRAVYVGAVPVTTSWAADGRVQKAPRPVGDERGGCRSHPSHDERSAKLPRERVRVLIRSLPLARGGLPLLTKHKAPLGPAKVALYAAHPRTLPLCPHPFAPSSWLWYSLGLCSGSSSSGRDDPWGTLEYQRRGVQRPRRAWRRLSGNKARR
jgi:hypothetical protein